MRTPSIILALLFAGGSALMLTGCEDGWEDLDRPTEPTDQPEPVPQYDDPPAEEEPLFEDDLEDQAPVTDE